MSHPTGLLRQLRWPLILPKDIQGVRCALVNKTPDQVQVIGLGSALLNFFEHRTNYNGSVDEVVRKVFDPDNVIRFKTLGQDIGAHVIPTKLAVVPDGSPIDLNGIAAVIECEDERYPWAPLLFREYVSFINAATSMSTDMSRFKMSLRYYAQRSVPPDQLDEELYFKVRTEIENFTEPSGSPIRSGVYLHFPGSGNIDTMERWNLEYDVPWKIEEDQYRVWGAVYSMDQDVVKRRIILPVSIDDLKDFGLFNGKALAEQFGNMPGTIALEMPHGYYGHEIPEIIKVAIDYYEHSGKRAYIKPEGIPLGRKETNIAHVSRFKPTQQYNGQAGQAISLWSESVSSSQCELNTRNFRVLPFKMLLPYSTNKVAMDEVMQYLYSKKKSIENLDFYIPWNFNMASSYAKPFQLEIIAVKRDGKWEKFGDLPKDMRMVFDDKQKVHVALDPDTVLEDIEGDSLKPDMQERVGIGEVDRNLLRILKFNQKHGPFVNHDEDKDPLLQ